MEDMLGRFQGNLGNISSEIRTLQEQSQGMSVKLRNRKAFEERLGGFLDNVAISSSLIEAIVQSPVDENYQASSLMDILIDMCITASLLFIASVMLVLHWFAYICLIES